MKATIKHQQTFERQWQLQDAKNRLSQVVERAVHDGPQTITLRGKPTAVVISFEEFRRLNAPQESLTGFLKKSPLHGLELDLQRGNDLVREVEL